MSMQTKRSAGESGAPEPKIVVRGEQAEALVRSRAEEISQPCGGMSRDEIREARTVIIAAKAAYQFKSPRWLPLFSNAMAAIERCPVEVRNRLKEELCVFHPQWHKRPHTA